MSSLLLLHSLNVSTLQNSVLPALHCACDTPVSSSLLGICSRLNGVTPLCILPAPPCCWQLRHPCSSLGLKSLRAPSAWLNPAMPLPPSSLSLVPPPVPCHAALQGPAQCRHLSAREPFVRLSGDGFPSPTHLFTAVGQQVWEESRDVQPAGRGTTGGPGMGMDALGRGIPPLLRAWGSGWRPGGAVPGEASGPLKPPIGLQSKGGLGALGELSCSRSEPCQQGCSRSMIPVLCQVLESHRGGQIIAGAALVTRQTVIPDSLEQEAVSKQKPADAWLVDEGWPLRYHHTLRRAWAGRASAFGG